MIGKWAGRLLPLALALALAVTGCGPGTHAHDPTKAARELNAGLAAHYAGRISEAQQHYRNALDYDTNSFFADYNLGVIEQNAGHDAAAEAYYRKTIAINAGMASAIYNLAIIRAKSDPAEAQSLYLRAITLQPQWATPHLNLGYLLLSQGHTDEARAEFDKAVALDPSLKSRLPDATPAPSPATASPSSQPSP